jgi:hypothetical protein
MRWWGQQAKIKPNYFWRPKYGGGGGQKREEKYANIFQQLKDIFHLLGWKFLFE